MAGMFDERSAREIARWVRANRGRPQNKVVPKRKQPPRTDGLKIYEGRLRENLPAATDRLTGPRAAKAVRYVKDPDNPSELIEERDDEGELIEHDLINRDTALSGSGSSGAPEDPDDDGEGDYVIWTKINGENRVLWLSCTPANEVQRLRITGSPTGGTFTLTYDGETTTPIDYAATADAVRSALEALPNIGDGNVECTGGPLPGSAVDIEFVGDLANTNVSLMNANGANLTGGSGVSIFVETNVEGCC